MLAAGAAMAQQQAPAADGGPGRPDVKTVGDWTVRCFPIQSPSPCDIFQEQDIRRPASACSPSPSPMSPAWTSHAIQISVPLDISIPKGATLQTDTYTSPVLKYRRCDRNGCYIEMAVDNGLVEGLAKSGAQGKVDIAADNGKNYALNFSLKGFSQAHDDIGRPGARQGQAG